MRVDLQHQDLVLNEYVREIIDRRVAKLEKRLERYHPDASHLTIKFAAAKKKEWFECALELKVVHKMLVAKREAPDLLAAFHEAYEALIKEFEKYRLTLNRSLRARKHPEPVAIAGTEKQVADWRALLEEAVKKKMKTLYRMARHELLIYQLNGVIEPGEIVPEEVVDEAILRVYQRISQQKTQVDLEHDLVREVINAARELAKDAQNYRKKKVSIDVSAEVIPDPEKVTTLGEEILYFYQPDEALKLEDVIADPNAVTPEQVVESEELQKLLYTFLSKLPADERTAFTLIRIEGFSVDEARMVMQKSADEINRLVRQAEEKLRSKLSKTGRPMGEEQLRKIYGSLRTLAFGISLEERMVAAQKLMG